MDQRKKNLYIMVVVQFMMMSGINIIVPFLPLFVKELGITEPGAARMWSGLLIGIHALFAALVSPIWGSVADRYGRKLMVIRSCLGVAIFTFLMAYAQSVYHILLLRTLQGCFSGFSAAALTLVASQTSKEKMGYALGLLQTGQVLGILAGPILGGLVSDFFSYRTTFQVTGLLALTAGISVLFFVREKFVPRPEGAKKNFFLELAGSWHLPIVQIMFVVLFCTQLSMRMVEPIMSLFVESMTDNALMVATLTGTVFTATGLAQTISLPFITRNSDRWGHRKVLIICFLGGAIFYFPQGLAGNLTILIILRFIYGLFLGGILPMINSLTGLLTPASHQGKVYGLTSSAFFLGGFVGPVSGGFLAAKFGFTAIFFLTAFLLVFNAILVGKKVPQPGADSSPQYKQGEIHSS
ncbi:MAG: multidrug efflux MFS transporter [Clostridia bacterium]|nr:multidrug efflux MFS transporter [Clostridia bacterium]